MIAALNNCRNHFGQSRSGGLSDEFKLVSVSRGQPESTPDKAAANLLSSRELSIEMSSSEQLVQFSKILPLPKVAALRRSYYLFAYAANGRIPPLVL